MNLSDVLNIRSYYYFLLKYSRKMIFIFIPLIFINIILITVIDLLSIEMDLTCCTILGIINAAIIIFWVLNRHFYIFQRHYFSKKISLVFRITSSNITSYEELQDKFFKKLSDELKNQFNIIILYDDIEQNNKKVIKIFKRLNATMIFDIKEESGNVDNDNSYSFTISGIYYKTDFYRMNNINNKHMNEKLKEDTINAINNYFQMSNKNSLADIKQSELTLEIGIRYIISIIYIINENPAGSYEQLKIIESNFFNHNLEVKNKNISYILSNLDVRFIDTYIGFYYKYLSNKNKKYNIEIAEKIYPLYDDYLPRLNNIRNRLTKEEYYYLKYSYYCIIAVLSFDVDGTDEALTIVEEWYEQNINISYQHKLDKAYLLACKSNYEDSLKIYKRLNKTKCVERTVIDSVIEFIEEHRNGKEDVSNCFCLCVINFYWGKKEVYYQELEILKKNNNELYELLTKNLM